MAVLPTLVGDLDFSDGIEFLFASFCALQHEAIERQQ